MSARAGKVGSVIFIDELRDDLLAADYTVDAVLARLGPAGQAGLDRNSTVPALRELGEARDPLATLIRLFPLGRPVPLADVAALRDGFAELDEQLRGHITRAEIAALRARIVALLDNPVMPTPDRRRPIPWPAF